MTIQIGQSALELLVEIVQTHGSIETMSLAIYRPTDGFLARIERSNPDLADRLRQDCRDVRWDNTLALDEQKLLIRERLYHDSYEEFDRRQPISAKEFTTENINYLIQNLLPDQTVAVCSVCTMRDGSTAHIPMMDFACTVEPRNLDLISMLVQVMGLRGAILNSGNSYHFYGFELLSQSDWLDTMAKFLLSAPLSDFRYIAHRLLGRACVLRISSSSSKPFVPTVSALIGTQS